MEDNLTKILTLVAAVGLGLFLGKLVFGRKKTGEPKIIQVKEIAKSTLLKPGSSIEMGHSVSPEVRRSSSASILEDKILYEEEVAHLLKIGQEIAASLNIADIAKSIVDNVVETLNVQICSIVMEDKSGDLRIKYAVGLSNEVIAGTAIKKGTSITGRVFSSNECIVVNDLRHDLRFKETNQEKYYLHSLISMPIAIKDKVLGVLNVSGKKNEQPFDSEDLRFIKGVASEASVALNSAILYEELQRSYLETITALASTIDAKDPYTYRHSENVTKLALGIAHGMNLNQTEIDTLRIASLLHDIGKIGIRDGILSKPGRLTEEEFQEIKKHPAKGEEILGVIPFLKKAAALVRHHHEWYDGNGYPDKIKEHQIELGARIIGVADTLDAMTSDRPYRKAMTFPEAFAELKRKSGSQFDPEIVAVLLKLAETKPELLTKES